MKHFSSISLDAGGPRRVFPHGTPQFVRVRAKWVLAEWLSGGKFLPSFLFSTAWYVCMSVTAACDFAVSNNCRLGKGGTIMWTT